MPGEVASSRRGQLKPPPLSNLRIHLRVARSMPFRGSQQSPWPVETTSFVKSAISAFIDQCLRRWPAVAVSVNKMHSCSGLIVFCATTFHLVLRYYRYCYCFLLSGQPNGLPAVDLSELCLPLADDAVRQVFTFLPF